MKKDVFILMSVGALLIWLSLSITLVALTFFGHEYAEIVLRSLNMWILCEFGGRLTTARVVAATMATLYFGGWFGPFITGSAAIGIYKARRDGLKPSDVAVLTLVCGLALCIPGFIAICGVHYAP